MKKKIICVAAESSFLDIFLRGQLQFLNNYYEVVGIASPCKETHRKISEREGIRTVEVEIKRNISLLRDLCTLIKLYKVFKKESPDIVHSLTPKAGLLCMLASWAAHVPVRVHTFTGLIFPWRKGYMRKLLKITDRLTCMAATTIIPEGEGVKKDLLNNNITNKTLKVLANGNINGVNLDYFKPVLKISPSTVTRFIFIGRIVRDKGIEDLKLAFERMENAELIFVGTFEQDLNPLSNNCYRWVRHGKRVTYVGFKDDIRPYLADADVLVFPSHREGFPNTPLQAGAMGLPTIATNICGCNEIIVDKVTGLLIEPHNPNQLYRAMKQLADNPGLRRKMGSEARVRIAERFSQQDVWNAILKFYQNVS
ncbi:glycosyltransferase family 4 protein [Bacteroides sp. 519]|uniref:glycosyltransferase family 4 protein n=1 Tax=Bacteroides sp. 519 TaxID=2302937 RepID=UPI0013D39786|nr:glycosyltransferase family 4 protein [Bacteroides sp. 519]NDV60217.1 glycosyltransferase family 1 protein [Bacteroides sp. 519]